MDKLKPQEVQAAIAYFEDAVKESNEIISDCTPALQAELTEQKQHFVVALEALRRAEPENKPLTLEQLRQMDGEPIYYQQIKSGYGRYRILNLTECPFPPKTFVNFDDSEKEELSENYGKTWLAYARKPDVTEDQPPQELCEENENFVQNKFGYCFYTLGAHPLIYNLYVHPQYRRHGHSCKLLQLVKGEIWNSGYEGEIRIQAEPQENSIKLTDLVEYYKSMGLTVCDARRPEQEEIP
jgi:ribosomal protein S18 acetylase RimI-like enzyme